MARPETQGVPGTEGLGAQDSETLRRALALARFMRNPALPGLIFLLLVIVAGCVTLVLAVFAMTDAIYVPLQLPFVISGGFTGVAFIAAGALLAAIQAERYDRAQARYEMQQAVDELSGLVRTVAHRYRAPSR